MSRIALCCRARHLHWAETFYSQSMRWPDAPHSLWQPHRLQVGIFLCTQSGARVLSIVRVIHILVSSLRCLQEGAHTRPPAYDPSLLSAAMKKLSARLGLMLFGVDGAVPHYIYPITISFYLLFYLSLSPFFLIFFIFLFPSIILLF